MRVSKPEEFYQHQSAEGLSLSCKVDLGTHRGVIGGDINQNLGGASAAHVSVAVPHTANQVGL